MTKEIDDAELERAARLYKEHGSERKAAKAAGLSKTAMHELITRAAAAGKLGFKPVLPGFEIKTVASNLDEAGNVKDEWVKQHKAACAKFEMPDGQVLKEVSAYVDSDGRIRSQWIKTKADAVTPHLIEALKQVFREYRGRARPVPKPRFVERDLMSVYPVADQHNGLLAWGRETGEAYDLKIGAERLLDCSSSLIAQSPRSRQAIILNLGDWQHADDSRNATPRSGHHLDVDGRWFKVTKTGVRLMKNVIELALAKHDRMLVRNIPGNHDPHASRALTIALSEFYDGNPRVTIDDDPGDHFFHRFGQTLVGATHGHNMRPEQMAMMMAVVQAEWWGRSKFRWFLYGHIHHERLREVGNVRVESFQTIAAKDAHAVSAGYTSGQSLNSITLHKSLGEIGRHRVNI